MNICFYIESLLPDAGGMERVTDVLSKEIAKAGLHTIYAISVNDIPDRENIYSQYKSVIQADGTKQGKDIERIVEFVNYNGIEIFVNQMFNSFASLPMQEGIKKHTKAKLINVKHTTPLLIDFVKTFHRQLPLPDCLNRALFSLYKTVYLKPKYIKGERLAYRFSDKFVVLAKSQIEEFKRLNRIKDQSGKISYINNPSIISERSETKRDRVMIVVGRLNNQQKRIDRILKFWKIWNHKHAGWGLKIIGSGPDEKFLKELSQTLNLRNIEFIDHHPSPEIFYRKAMIYLSVSDIEGWGMSICEAMSCGCVPIVMDTYSAIHDIITDGINGVIVPRDNLMSMVRAAEQVESDFDRMSKHACCSMQKFSSDKIASDWNKLFSDL